MALLIVVKVAGRSTGKSRTGYGTPQGGDWLRGALPLQSLKRVATISTRKEKPEIIGIQEWENERGGKNMYARPRYIFIFLKSTAPIIVIARLKPPMTAKQTTGLIWDAPVRP